MSALVTVVLTVYKRVDYLPEALQSALAQTFCDKEIIVVDDSGTEAAREICAPHIASGAIIYLPNPTNVGIVSSIREAVKRASGKYIAILNDDDAWEPEFLAHVIPPMEADNSVVLSFCEHWIIDGEGDIDEAYSEENPRIYHRDYLAKGAVPNPSEFVLMHNGVPLAMASAFRKNAINWSRFTNEIVGAYDFWLSCLLAATGQNFYFTPERLTRYRIHGQMETGRRSIDKFDNKVYIYATLLELNSFPDYQAHLQGELANAKFHAGKDRLYFSKRADARDLFRAAIQLQTKPKYIVAYLLTFAPQALLKAAKLAT
ncbi:glycosyltransferase family 2 protein [Cerasicoccus maritimus]|uniref:glycosyltransferase family 2 protein n=1 Tax=Cerasicoccus maritimus TaxID=490089 RepID=UPI00285273D1|nr:glycosyltransferase family 2 protein [Cerasicoccus maritimus]